MTFPSEDFRFGRGLPGGDRCCQKPVGCTNADAGCLFLNHQWKREHVPALRDAKRTEPELPPDDVLAWVRETYTSEGVAIWLRAYQRAYPLARRQMISRSRLDQMGT